MERKEYFHKGERYAVGLTGDDKRRFAIIAIKYNSDGKSERRMVESFCHFKTFDEAQTALDDYAKLAGFKKY